jgi:hypothetical protein
MRVCTTDSLLHRHGSVGAPKLRGPSVRKARSRRVDLEALETRELLSGDTAWDFVSAPQLHPARVSVITSQPQLQPVRHLQNHLARAGLRGRLLNANPGDIFVAPYPFGAAAIATTQAGTQILDPSGSPVWVHPAIAPNVNFDFKEQTFMGRPVLTWWEGSAATGGAGGLPIGTAMPGSRFVIYNNHYQQMRIVTAKNGFNADLHDFEITPKGIGVVIGTKVQNADLTPYGGPSNGQFLDTEIQGINLRTGRLMFSWDLGTHVPLGDSYLPVSPSPDIVWDPYHVNSVDVTPDGKQLLVSVRHTSSVYDVSLPSGKILWQLGGKHPTLHVDSSLVTGPDGTAFQYQHDARFVPGGISLFDNGGLIPGSPTGGPFGPGRGLVFGINTATSTATIQGAPYYHTPSLFPNSQGNVQSLPNGDKFIGWGADPQLDGTAKSYFSEYASNGTQVFDAVLPDNVVGKPEDRVRLLEWVDIDHIVESPRGTQPWAPRARRDRPALGL